MIQCCKTKILLPSLLRSVACNEEFRSGYVKGDKIMQIEKLADKIVYMDDKLTKKIIFKESRVLNFVLNFRPGQGVPPHNHEQSDMVIHVLVGQGQMGVDGKIYEIVKGDVIHCLGTEVFSVTNTGDKDMSCFVILAPNPSPMYSEV